MPGTKNKSNQLFIKQLQLFADLVSGFITGILCSALFNPWDRGLFLSVKYKRPFLSFDNFTAPYQGLTQAIVQRSILGSIYFVMQGQMKTYLAPYLHDQQGISEPKTQFCIGMVSGTISGIVTNPISAVKYHSWGKENILFSSSVKQMWAQGGIKSFIKGTRATVGRDMVFGSTYEVLRHLMQDKLSKSSLLEEYQSDFLYNTPAAAIAAIASGPLNYARNIQYATPPNAKIPKIGTALNSLLIESQQHNQTFLKRMYFFQQRLNVGWGTGRASVGMATGQVIFDYTREKIRGWPGI